MYKYLLIFRVTAALLFFPKEVFGQNFPQYSVSIAPGETGGYYFLTPGSKAGSYHALIDGKGELVYFKRFGPGIKTSDFKLQPNGLMSYHLEDKTYLLDSTFRIVDSVTSINGIRYDNHDFHILPNGNFMVLGFETQQKDLSNLKGFNKNGSPGSKEATLKYSVIQELDANKKLVFQWSSKEYYDLKDIDTSRLSDPAMVDMAHINAVEYDTDGNLLVSARNFTEITKINHKDGSVMWRLGGNKNQFRFINDPGQFKSQHDARRLKNGHITLFDNGAPGIPFHPARAVEYELNEKTLTASLVWSYTNDPLVYSLAAGNTQRLSQNSTLISYGVCKRVNTVFNLVNSSGTKLFELSFKDTLFTYRAFEYPGLPWNLKRPEIRSYKKDGKIYLEAKTYYSRYYWSTGERSRVIEIKSPGKYQVFIPAGEGGYISSPAYNVKDL